MEKLIEILEFLRDKEYHKEEKLIFINNLEYDDFARLLKGSDFSEHFLTLYFSGNYFSVNVEDMLNCIDEEITEVIIKKIEKENE